MFDQQYYDKLMKENGYDPLAFEKIDFSLGSLTPNDIQRRWLCHHNASDFSVSLNKGKGIVSTGFGLSGTPHLGTLSQILRALHLQKEGIPVQMVMGDLDAHNGKGISLERTLELAERYKKFATTMGFHEENGSVLRSQFDATEVLRTSYLLGHYMTDEQFLRAEEDLHAFYSGKGKVDDHMSYRRKLSLNLMTADFVHLMLYDSYDEVLVMLGIDEHQYVRFGQETIAAMQETKEFSDRKMKLSAIYSPIIKGLNNYPKMSKSFPNSGISLDMSEDEIKKRVLTGEGDFQNPEDNVVYQMIAGASYFSPQKLKQAYNSCLRNDSSWDKIKLEYVDQLIGIAETWRRS